MRRGRLPRAFCILLTVLVLLGAGGTVAYHGEWWYPLVWRSSHRDAPALREVTDDIACRLWTPDELRAAGAVESYSLMLINAEHPLPQDFTPVLIEYNGARMHPLMQEGYVAMRDAVQARTGIRIYVASDYRTSEEQRELYEADGSNVAASVGCSEHEAGLALDVYAPRYDGEDFLRSRAGRRVNEVCGDYGYIIRYPIGKEAITGIRYEPWHLRYVGAPHAKIMSDAGLSLEEYINLLTPGTRYESGDYVILRCRADEILLPEGFLSCEISPDNTGCYVITLRMR